MRARMLVLAVVCAAFSAQGQDMEKGREINAVCAACHGDNGQGGKKGEYPRLAGQPATFLATQLKAFRARQRINIPMFPYTQERELSDEDIRDVSGYLSSVRLSTRMPEFRGDEDALTRLLMVDQVMIVPRVEGEAESGGRLYQDKCAFCHGKTGKGGGRFPLLVGQYTNYLKRQVDAYLRKERAHDDDDGVGVLSEIGTKDIQDILSYLTTIQESH